MKLIRSMLLGWVANAIVLLVVTLLLDKVTNEDTGSLLIAAAVFGILNNVLKPLLNLVTVPLAIMTLGLIRFAVAMAMLGLTSLLVDGFHIQGITTLFIATIVVWIVDRLVDIGLGLFDRRQPA